MDKLEGYFVKNLERSLHKSYNKPLQKIGLLPEAASPYTKLPILRYMRNWFALCVILVLFAFMVMVFYAVWLIFDKLTWHQIQKHSHALIRNFFVVCKPEVYALSLMPFWSTLSYGAGIYPTIWAWNRRADRLNREGNLPLPVAAAVTGVWPPPPTVPAGDLPEV